MYQILKNIIYINVKKYLSFIEKFEIKQKKRKKFKKRLVISLSLLFLFFLAIFYYNNIIKTIVLDRTKASIDKLITNSINSSITEALKEKTISFDNLVVKNMDAEGKVSSLSVDATIFNQIANVLANKTTEKLDYNCRPGIAIPIGTLSGLYFLNGKGSDIIFSCVPVGVVECKINSVFDESGINQTIHKLYINICANVSVSLPIKNITLSNEISFLAVENIIVGEVPFVFIN